MPFNKNYSLIHVEGKNKVVKKQLINMNFYNEEYRLESFKYWPVAFIDKKLMALTGLRYLNKKDAVQCVFCSVKLIKWEINDDPVNEHFRHSPNCPLLLGEPTKNIPIDVDAFQKMIAELNNRPADECGIYKSEYLISKKLNKRSKDDDDVIKKPNQKDKLSLSLNCFCGIKV